MIAASDFPWFVWMGAGLFVWLAGGFISGFDLEDRHDRSIGPVRLIIGGAVKLLGSLSGFVGTVLLAKWAWA